MPEIVCSAATCPLKVNPTSKFCADCGSKRADKEGPPAIICDETPCGLKTDPGAKFCSECGDSRSMKEDNPFAQKMRDAQQEALDKRDLAMDEARRTRNYGGRMEEVHESPSERHASDIREEGGQLPGRPLSPEERAAAERRLTAARIAAKRPRVARDPKIEGEMDEDYLAVTTLDHRGRDAETMKRIMPHGHGRTAPTAREGKHEIGHLSSGKLPADYQDHVRVLPYKFTHSTHPVGTARAFAESRQRSMDEVAKRGNTNEWGFEKQDGDEDIPSPEEVAAEQRRKQATAPRSKWRQDRMDADKKKR